MLHFFDLFFLIFINFHFYEIVDDLYQDLAKLDILFSGSDLAGFVCGFSKFRSRSSPRRLYTAFKFPQIRVLVSGLKSKIKASQH